AAGDGNAVPLDPATLDAIAGLYHDVETGEPLRIVRESTSLRIDGGTALRAQSGSRFVASNGRRFEFEAPGRLRVVDQFGSADRYERVADADLKPRTPSDYAGTYTSEEAEVTMTAAIQDGVVVLRRRPDSTLRLTPVYADGFRGQIGFVRFHRDASGQITGFSVSQERVWDLRFTRQAER
ncbi:MAG TPA: hypothetical protein VLD67_18450, partial [Vicinamibacterales bacterium]|nr:hypothetical protein [Vicinamibacterales bacterium]